MHFIFHFEFPKVLTLDTFSRPGLTWSDLWENFWSNKNQK